MQPSYASVDANCQTLAVTASDNFAQILTCRFTQALPNAQLRMDYRKAWHVMTTEGTSTALKGPPGAAYASMHHRHQFGDVQGRFAIVKASRGCSVQGISRQPFRCRQKWPPGWGSAVQCHFYALTITRKQESVSLAHAEFYTGYSYPPVVSLWLLCAGGYLSTT